MNAAVVAAIPARCDQCSALCCQLKVVLADGDSVPDHLVDRRPGGPTMMRRDAAGWCAALDRTTHRCTIYSQRPATCRRFVMDGSYCRSVRAEHEAQRDRGQFLSVQ